MSLKDRRQDRHDREVDIEPSGLFGSDVEPTAQDWSTFDDGDTTPDIALNSHWKTGNTSTTTITNFDNPKTNIHRLVILFADANTTIQNNANIVIQAGEDFTGVVDDMKVFYWDGANWVEQTVDVVGGSITRFLFTIWNPKSVQSDDNEYNIWGVTDADLTITSIRIGLNTAAQEVAGDLKYADDFITQANAVVINSFDTTNGVLLDTSITSGAVPAGKCIILEWDSAPDAAITQMNVDIEFDYD